MQQRDRQRSGRQLQLRHAAVRVQQAVRQRAVHPEQLRLPVARRAARRRPPAPSTARRHAERAEHQPAQLRPDHRRLFPERLPARCRTGSRARTGRAAPSPATSSSTTSAWRPTCASRAATPTRASSPRRCPMPERCASTIENIENNRSDTVPILDFRVDKAFRVGRYKFTGMFDAFNLTNSDAGDQLQPDQRRRRTTRSSRRSTRARSSSASGSISSPESSGEPDGRRVAPGGRSRPALIFDQTCNTSLSEGARACPPGRWESGELRGLADAPRRQASGAARLKPPPRSLVCGASAKARASAPSFDQRASSRRSFAMSGP